MYDLERSRSSPSPFPLGDLFPGEEEVLELTILMSRAQLRRLEQQAATRGLSLGRFIRQQLAASQPGEKDIPPWFLHLTHG